MNINIYSSHGELSANPVTGVVCKDLSVYYDENSDELKNIIRVDVAEFKSFWGVKPQDCDILDIGYWYLDGDKEKYEKPAMDWRMDTVIPMLRETAKERNIEIPEGATPAQIQKLTMDGKAFGAVPKGVAPPAPQVVVAVTGDGYWGKGADLEDAISKCREQGSRGSQIAVIYIYTSRSNKDLDGIHVDDGGSIHYNPSTTTSNRVGRVKLPMKQQPK